LSPITPGVEQESHPARWEELDVPEAVIRYDKRNRPYNANVGTIRNAAMVAAGAGMCLAFHRAISATKGTNNCARRAIEAGIPTYLIDSDAARPKRLEAGDARLSLETGSWAIEIAESSHFFDKADPIVRVLALGCSLPF
jgi:hypothetical protein